MEKNLSVAQIVASFLLSKKAVRLQPTDPFTWASGWKSPIYCDCRELLSFSKVRKQIKKMFADYIRENYPNVKVIAGVATSGISWATLIADELDLPMIYVRAEAKEHGRKNLIEGRLSAGDDVLVIEDLISTGKSSMQVIQNILDAHGNVLGILAIFEYGFPIAKEKLAGYNPYALSNYETLVHMAVEENYVSASDQTLLQEWRKTPEVWGKS